MTRKVRIGSTMIRPSETQRTGKVWPVRSRRAFAQRPTTMLATMPTRRVMGARPNPAPRIGSGVVRPRLLRKTTLADVEASRAAAAAG